MSDNNREINERIDELFNELANIKSQLSRHDLMLTHFYNEEAASRVSLVKDETQRDLGRKPHTCRICGAKGDFKTYLSREMMQGKRDEFEYFECDECNCLQITEVPDNLGDYYGEGYYSYAMQEDPDRKYKTPVTRTDKLLDVGCGTGAWLVGMADSGCSNLYGCDPFIERDIHYGDRVHIRKCTIHEVEGDGTFKVVRMGDSFEHMTDPLEALMSARRLITDDGIVEMSIPTYPNIAFEVFGPHWYQLDAPRHIFLHSRKSIEYLAGKSGLEVVQFKYDSNNAQMLRSFFYMHGVTFNAITGELIKRFFKDEQIRDFDAKSAECNENGYGDHMIVYFRKK